MTSFNSSGGRDVIFPLNGPLNDDYDECIDEECKEECQDNPIEPSVDLIIYMSIRCAVTVFTVVLIVLVFVNIARGIRVKSWRLYLLTAITLFAWIGMSLYQDHFDNYYVNWLACEPQPRSIYECVRNLTHGLTLFLIVLVLGHMSDFQHHGSWLGLVFAVVLVPLLYSVGLIVVDLRLDPELRRQWETGVAITAVRVALYNVVTTVLVVVFSRRICTRTLYGTYEDHRRPLVVLTARWTFVFLVAHNLTETASFISATLARIPSLDPISETTTQVQQVLDEVKYLLIVLAVPFSYVVAALANCCCGVESNSDFDGMDKIYSEQVWTPTAGSTTTNIQNKPLPEPGQGRQPMPSSNPNGVSMTPNRSMVSTSRGTESNQGSVSTLTSIGEASDSVGQLRPSSAASNASKIKNRQSYLDAVSYGSTGPPPSNGRPQSRNKRESYLEAMSMGSLDGSASGRAPVLNTSFDQGSVSSEPVDL